MMGESETCYKVLHLREFEHKVVKSFLIMEYALHEWTLTMANQH